MALATCNLTNLQLRGPSDSATVCRGLPDGAVYAQWCGMRTVALQHLAW